MVEVEVPFNNIILKHVFGQIYFENFVHPTTFFLIFVRNYGVLRDLAP